MRIVIPVSCMYTKYKATARRWFTLLSMRSGNRLKQLVWLSRKQGYFPKCQTTSLKCSEVYMKENYNRYNDTVFLCTRVANSHVSGV